MSTPYRQTYIESAREILVAYWRDKLHKTPLYETTTLAQCDHELHRIRGANLDELLIELKAVVGIFNMTITDIEKYQEAKAEKEKE